MYACSIVVIIIPWMANILFYTKEINLFLFYVTAINN